jgi:hypothetical protein
MTPTTISYTNIENTYNTNMSLTPTLQHYQLLKQLTLRITITNSNSQGMK